MEEFLFWFLILGPHPAVLHTSCRLERQDRVAGIEAYDSVLFWILSWHGQGKHPNCVCPISLVPVWALGH